MIILWCATLFVSLCLFAQKQLKNGRSEIDVIWREYVLRWSLEVTKFWKLHKSTVSSANVIEGIRFLRKSPIFDRFSLVAPQPSVCPSVKRVNCDKTEEKSVQIFSDMSSSVRLSVVCNVRAPYLGDWNFRQCFSALFYLGYPGPLCENLTEIVPGEPLRRGGLKPRGVAKYSDFWPFEGYISETMQDMI